MWLRSSPDSKHSRDLLVDVRCSRRSFFSKIQMQEPNNKGEGIPLNSVCAVHADHRRDAKLCEMAQDGMKERFTCPSPGFVFHLSLLATQPVLIVLLLIVQRYGASAGRLLR